MAYVRVDESEDKDIDGFSYNNKHDLPEYVKLQSGDVTIETSDGEEIFIYKEDIPKLIKALQAAKLHMEIK